MKIVSINFDSIEFSCMVKLNQKDNIDSGFEIMFVKLGHDFCTYNFQYVLDQDKLIKLIHKELKKEVLRQNTLHQVL